MARSSGALGPHLYVVGEDGDDEGPVKIGLTAGHISRSGRPNLQAGNWRQLVVLHREPIAYEDLRWTEWLIHQNLRPRRVLGEWFKIRDLVPARGGWASLLERAQLGRIRGCARWSLERNGHRLERVTRLTVGEPRQFAAHCSCGHVLVGDLKRSMSTVLAQLAVEHLGYGRRDPVVIELRRLFRAERAADPIDRLPDYE